MQIIAFEPGYEDQVVDLILPIQREEFGIEISADDQPDLRAIPDFYQRGAGNFWLAVDAGRVLGTIALIDIGDGQLALRKMFVRADARGAGRGIARQLLETALGWAAGHGVHTIWLGTTAAYHAAHRFYEKHRFVEVAKAELPAAFPVMAVDTKFYRFDVVNHDVAAPAAGSGRAEPTPKVPDGPGRRTGRENAMESEALADRIINYSDAAAAFSVVNALAFIVTLADPDIRCSMATIAGPVVVGNIVMAFGLTALLVALRRFELSLRGGAPTDARVARFWRSVQAVRIGVVWCVATFVSLGVVSATFDVRCLPPG